MLCYGMRSGDVKHMIPAEIPVLKNKVTIWMEKGRLGLDSMPRKISIQNTGETFGQRLARIRKAAGYSQRSLAAEISISHRMVAYYETQTSNPPTHILPALAEALNVSTDQLLGRSPVSPRKAPRNQRLLRQLRQIEKLPPRARHAVLETIQALVEKYGLAG